MIDMDFWKEYYSNELNMMRISNECRYREVIVIKHLDRDMAIRPLKIFKPEHLKFWIERLSLTTTLFDLYISNTSVRLPPLTSNLQRLGEYRKYLADHWTELSTGYDIFVDIDIDNENQRKDACIWGREIAHILAQEYPGVELWDTSRGYHVVCKGQFNPEFVKELVQDICCEQNIPMSMPIKDKDGVRYIARNQQWMPIKTDIEQPEITKPNCDTKIYDDRRIRRCPYSLHSKTGKPMIKIS